MALRFCVSVISPKIGLATVMVLCNELYENFMFHEKLYEWLYDFFESGFSIFHKAIYKALGVWGASSTASGS